MKTGNSSNVIRVIFYLIVSCIRYTQFYVGSLMRLPCQSAIITVANFKTLPETRDSVVLC